MKKLNLAALLLGAALFTGLGVTTASAEGSKCGAGKCGDAKPAKTASKCGAGKCGDAKAAKTTSKCGTKDEMKPGKCGTGKCGDAKAKPASKCGGNK